MDFASTLKADYLIECGDLFEKYGDWERAIELYSKILKGNLNQPAVLKRLGMAFCCTHQFSQAERCFWP